MHSLMYEQIYQSEIIEDVYDIKPSLLAEIKVVPNKDSRIRLYVYYTSSVTGGKVIL
jgi:hypothetical protein